jgi:DNA-binding FadR family transcriptional regulator
MEGRRTMATMATGALTEKLAEPHRGRVARKSKGFPANVPNGGDATLAKGQVAPKPPVKRGDEDLKRVHRYLEESGLDAQDRLPPERELADVLGLSRARLRNALRKMVTEGLIWRHVGRGTFFGPIPLATSGGELGIVLADLTNPREIMEARLVLEPEFASIAAIRGTRQDFNEMDACLEKLRVAPSGPIWELWDVRLHRLVAKATENNIMLGMFDLIHSNRNKEVWGNLRKIFHTPERMQTLQVEHQAVVDAIKARNPEDAQQRMRTHLQLVQRTIFRDR